MMFRRLVVIMVMPAVGVLMAVFAVLMVVVVMLPVAPAQHQCGVRHQCH